MSTVKTKFTLHNNHKDFKLGISQVTSKSVLPYTYRMNPIMLILSTVTSIAIFMLIVFGILGFLVDRFLFNHFSEVVDAQIIACEVQYSSKGGYTPKLTYSYVWNQTSFTDTALMMGAHNNPDFCENTLNKTIAIRVLTPNPKRTQPLLAEASTLPLEGVIIIVVVLIGLLIFRDAVYESAESVMLHISAAIAPRRLNREGIILEGEIIYVVGFFSEPPKPYPYVIGVIYRFENADKQQLTGYAEARRDDLKDSELPPIGTPVAVLYADDHAHMML